MISRSQLIAHAEHLLKTSASSVVLDLCSKILELEPPPGSRPDTEEVASLRLALAEKDAQISRLEEATRITASRRPGRPAVAVTDDQKRENRRAYMRKWRARSKG